MSLKATFRSYLLKFRFEAGTSRGILKQRRTYFLELSDTKFPSSVGLGEAGPLAGLSPDYGVVAKELEHLCQRIEGWPVPSSIDQVPQMLKDLVPISIPSVRFALETALIDLINGAKKILFPGPFTEDSSAIAINGLVWMGSYDFMKQQVDEKVAAGFDCIKLKIGAINFEEECRLLEYIRTKYRQTLSIRVDANGAFQENNVHRKLSRLSQYQLHSIEQPIRPGQLALLKAVCESSIVPVALDEELVGVLGEKEQQKLLDTVNPRYVVLKPTLLGGLEATRTWIQLAEARNIGWWITSALESNIGLNAIAQFTGSLETSLHQGLGTGMLYHNNLPSNLHIEGGMLVYKP